MKRGFTLLEVMISLAVMTIGAAALFGMQGMIARSNLFARQMTTATEVAETWIERLKADALYWNAASPAATPALNLANTLYLQAIGGNAGVWMAAGTDAGLGHSPAFDHTGSDVTLANQNQGLIAFCTGYRLSWVVPGQSIRADVRAFWPRDNMPANFYTNYPLCNGDQDAISPGGAQAANYHAVYASTVLRWNRLP